MGSTGSRERWAAQGEGTSGEWVAGPQAPVASSIPNLLVLLPFISQYLRWYVDGQLLYEINEKALVAQTNGTGACGRASWLPGRGALLAKTDCLHWQLPGRAQPAIDSRRRPACSAVGAGAFVGQRLIPLEPMYIIFNLVSRQARHTQKGAHAPALLLAPAAVPRYAGRPACAHPGCVRLGQPASQARGCLL